MATTSPIDIQTLQDLENQLRSAVTLDELNTAVTGITNYNRTNPSTEANDLDILAIKAQTAWTNAVNAITGYPTTSDSINEIREAAGLAAAEYIINGGTNDNEASIVADAAAEQKAFEKFIDKFAEFDINDVTTLVELDGRIGEIDTYITDNFSINTATKLKARLTLLRIVWNQAINIVTDDIDNAYPEDSADLDEIKKAARLAVIQYFNDDGSDIGEARLIAKNAADAKAIELGYNSPSNTPSYTPSGDNTPSYTPSGDNTPSDTPSGDNTPSDTPSGDNTPSDTPTNTPLNTPAPPLVIQSNSYYQNYQIRLVLGPEDFNLPFGTNLTTVIQSITNNFQPIAGGTFINSKFTVPSNLSISGGLTGWVTLFIFQLANYFDFSLERIYNVNYFENSVNTTDSSVINVGYIGITTPNNSTSTGSLTIRFNINNKPNSTPLPNDFLSAVAVGEWMKQYFNGFSGSTNANPFGLDNPSVTVPYPITIQPPLPGMPRKTPTLKNVALGKPDMSNYIPNTFAPGPEVTLSQFSSQINNIFKKRNNKKVKEHFNSPNTTEGIILHENDTNQISPMLVAPSGYNSTNNTWSTYDITFNLTANDFNTSESELRSIWQRMIQYVPNISYTFFGIPSTLTPGTTVATGVSGFIEQFLDVYSKILQVSNTRFTNITVLPNGVTSATLPDTITFFKITTTITNFLPAGVPYQKNDFLSAATIGTWLLSYWSTFTSNITQLPPFIPVPVQTTPINPGIGVPYTITLDAPLPGPTQLSLYDTTMVNPLSTFIGSVDQSIDIIKLTSRIKNLSSPSIETFSEHFSSNHHR